MKRTGGGTGFNGDKIVCDKLFLSLKINIIFFFSFDVLRREDPEKRVERNSQ